MELLEVVQKDYSKEIGKEVTAQATGTKKAYIEIFLGTLLCWFGNIGGAGNPEYCCTETAQHTADNIGQVYPVQGALRKTGNQHSAQQETCITIYAHAQTPLQWQGLQK